MNDRDSYAQRADELRARMDWVRRKRIREIRDAHIDAVLKACIPADTFSTWLTGGAAGAAALMLANSPGLVSLMGRAQFAASIDDLVMCGFIGLGAKLIHLGQATILAVDDHRASGVDGKIDQMLDDLEAIQKIGEESGVKVDVSVDPSELKASFDKALPAPMGWLRRLANPKEHNIAKAKLYWALIHFCVVGAQVGAFVGFVRNTVGRIA